ncbi:MAG: hypothetical protein DA407_10555 [Bacteroidetes bacterium]|nr:MAG: hypothetical protein DA407_10555 [Bacteroidota bacterium]
MRTNNSKVKNVIISMYFILIVLAILLATLFSAFSDLTNSPTLTFFIVIGVFVFLLLAAHKVSKYFEYDSDGVQVVIINKGMLLSDYFNYREHKLEFEKEQLIGYKFNNYFIYKSLVLYLTSRHGHNKTETFNVSLVGRKKRKYIRQSLSKIIKHNRTIKEQMND